MTFGSLSKGGSDFQGWGWNYSNLGTGCTKVTMAPARPSLQDSLASWTILFWARIAIRSSDEDSVHASQVSAFKPLCVARSAAAKGSLNGSGFSAWDRDYTSLIIMSIILGCVRSRKFRIFKDRANRVLFRQNHKETSHHIGGFIVGFKNLLADVDELVKFIHDGLGDIHTACRNTFKFSLITGKAFGTLLTRWIDNGVDCVIKRVSSVLVSDMGPVAIGLENMDTSGCRRS